MIQWIKISMFEFYMIIMTNRIAQTQPLLYCLKKRRHFFNCHKIRNEAVHNSVTKDA